MQFQAVTWLHLICSLAKPEKTTKRYRIVITIPQQQKSDMFLFLIYLKKENKQKVAELLHPFKSPGLSIGSTFSNISRQSQP